LDCGTKWCIRQVGGKIKEVKPKSEGGAAMALRLRALTEEEAQTIRKWSQSRTDEARLVERAKMIRLASEGHQVSQVAQAMGVNEKTVRKWLKRMNEQGVTGLCDEARTASTAALYS
jgi:DNA-binding NarL/FixJ family response regulator